MTMKQELAALRAENAELQRAWWRQFFASGMLLYVVCALLTDGNEVEMEKAA